MYTGIDCVYVYAKTLSNLIIIMNGSKSKRYCSVPGCRTYVSKDVSLHFFPKSERLKEEWAHVLNLKKVTKFMSVCSKHFVQSDFISTTNFIRRRLRKTAVPSQNLSHEQNALKGNAIQQRKHSMQSDFISTTSCIRRRLRKSAVSSQNLSHEQSAIQQRMTSKNIREISNCVSNNQDEGVIEVNVLDELEKMHPKLDIRSLFSKAMCGKMDTNKCKAV